MDEYNVIGLIGRGGFGEAILVQRKDGNGEGELRVVKKVDLSQMTPEEKENALNEAQVLSMLSHQNVIRYYDSFVENSTLHILMEYGEAGDLKRLIKQRRGEYFTEEILLGLRHIHHMHILHRDLKSQNVFITKAHVVKVGDFGIAKVVEGPDDYAKTNIGTPANQSPELLNGDPYNMKSDMWAAGCILYELAALQHPFEAPNPMAIALNIMGGARAALPPHFSDKFLTLVDSLLNYDPDEALSTPFIIDFVYTHLDSLLPTSENTDAQTPLPQIGDDEFEEDDEQDDDEEAPKDNWSDYDAEVDNQTICPPVKRVIELPNNGAARLTKPPPQTPQSAAAQFIQQKNEESKKIREIHKLEREKKALDQKRHSVEFYQKIHEAKSKIKIDKTKPPQGPLVEHLGSPKTPDSRAKSPNPSPKPSSSPNPRRPSNIDSPRSEPSRTPVDTPSKESPATEIRKKMHGRKPKRRMDVATRQSSRGESFFVQLGDVVDDKGNLQAADKSFSIDDSNAVKLEKIWAQRDARNLSSLFDELQKLVGVNGEIKPSKVGNVDKGKDPISPAGIVDQVSLSWRSTTHLGDMIDELLGKLCDDMGTNTFFDTYNLIREAKTQPTSIDEMSPGMLADVNGILKGLDNAKRTNAIDSVLLLLSWEREYYRR